MPYHELEIADHTYNFIFGDYMFYSIIDIDGRTTSVITDPTRDFKRTFDNLLIIEDDDPCMSIIKSRLDVPKIDCSSHNIFGTSHNNIIYIVMTLRKVGIIVMSFNLDTAVKECRFIDFELTVQHRQFYYCNYVDNTLYITLMSNQNHCEVIVLDWANDKHETVTIDKKSLISVIEAYHKDHEEYYMDSLSIPKIKRDIVFDLYEATVCINPSNGHHTIYTRCNILEGSILIFYDIHDQEYGIVSCGDEPVWNYEIHKLFNNGYALIEHRGEYIIYDLNQRCIVHIEQRAPSIYPAILSPLKVKSLGETHYNPLLKITYNETGNLCVFRKYDSCQFIMYQHYNIQRNKKPSN